MSPRSKREHLDAISAHHTDVWHLLIPTQAMWPMSLPQRGIQ